MYYIIKTKNNTIKTYCKKESQKIFKTKGVLKIDIISIYYK